MTQPSLADHYDAVYQGKTPIGGRPPWDIGAPQPEFVALEQAGGISGDVLDAGCGTGENSLFLAEKGYAVTGIDVSPVAVEQAREKAAQRGLSAEFAAADALELAGYSGRFDTVVDCGLLHGLQGEDRVRYAAALHRACRLGARVHLLENSERSRAMLEPKFAELGVPEAVRAQFRGLGEADVRAAFADGWTLESFDEATLEVRFPHSPDPIRLPAMRATLRRD